MKKVTKSIAAIAVIFGSLVVGGNAALAISLPPIDPVVIPEYDGNGNPMQSSKPKDNEEYILFPKARDKEYEKINFKDY